MVFGFFVTIVSTTAATRNIEEWEKCKDKAGTSVDQGEVGVSGVESAIIEQCGIRPVDESGSVSGIGVSPYDLVRSNTWKEKFVRITKAKYDEFVNRLGVSGTTTSEEGWIVGDGLMPHSGGHDEAAFAINIASGEVFGAMLEDGNNIRGFGFGTSWEDAPKFLQGWAKKREKDRTESESYKNESRQKTHLNITQEIKNRCQTQMGQYGAAMVKACVDQDIDAAQALNVYLKNHTAIVTRCLSQMGKYGYAMAKACADQDIEAENALQKY